MARNKGGPPPPRYFPCRTMVNQGSCSEDSCPYSHQIFTCEACNVISTSHRHHASHLKGKKHQKQIQDLARDQDRNGIIIQETDRVCDVCDRVIPARDFQAHERTKRHTSKRRVALYIASIAKAQENKHGVEVSPREGVDFGILDDSSPGKLGLDVKIKNLSDEPVILMGAKFVGQRGGGLKPFSFEEDYVWDICRPDSTLTIRLSFDSNQISGRFEDSVEFSFHSQQSQDRFIILRRISATCGDPAILQQFTPIAPYKRKNKPLDVGLDPENIVPGIRPPQLAKIEWATTLPEFSLPTAVIQSLAHGTNRDRVREAKEKLLPRRGLDEGTHADYYAMLLHIEEEQMRKDIRSYDMDGVKLDPSGKYLALKVPGLAEKRPSVIVGDVIRVQQISTGNQRWYEGCVHVVRQQEVLLRFHGSFNPPRDTRFNVRFTVSRIPLRRMHQALCQRTRNWEILFPIWSTRLRPASAAYVLNLETFDPLIMNNRAQKEAVASILTRSHGDLPFVIFGPPGTGKTVTVVEAIRQLIDTDRNARILACAPSNDAADLLALKLKDFGPRIIFRLNAPSRNYDERRYELDSISRQEDGIYRIPPREELERFRIVVSTCLSAAVPLGIGVEPGHFSHIFLDEAAQAMEPEAFVPIKTMHAAGTSVILAGDPKQLGPILRSPVSKAFGLGRSYLERLLALGAYDLKKSRGITVVKLTQNFRNHPSILKYPNERFYDDELEVHASFKTTAVLSQWPEIAKHPDFPLIFHAVKGRDEREASSPSFFNIHEIAQVKRYVDALRSNRLIRFTDTDIGVISPYHSQCQKIRAALRGQWDGVKVGSVETFQGQERKVIVMSTVRSNADYLEMDVKHSLGFVGNERRFNVAITRAQAGLIIVGDPTILGGDKLWKRFLTYIHRNGGWRGIPIPWADDEDDSWNPRKAEYSAMETLIRRVNGLDIDSDSEDGQDEQDEQDEREQEIDAGGDKPWRELE